MTRLHHESARSVPEDEEQNARCMTVPPCWWQVL
jgi:hypothetical protein